MRALLGDLVYLGVPPVAFAITTLGGLLLARLRRRAGYAIAMLSALILLLLAMPAVSESLLASLETGLPLAPSAGDPPQAIVVLGGDISVGAEGEESPGSLSLDRLRAGAVLARRTGLPVLICGGRLGRGEDPISAVMARSMQTDFSVPVRWTEDRSISTWENAEFTAGVLRAANISTVYVVTQGWHMRRAVLAFRHFGLHVVAAPTQLNRPPPRFAWIYFLPLATAWLDSYYALHEYIGYVYYALPG